MDLKQLDRASDVHRDVREFLDLHKFLREAIEEMFTIDFKPYRARILVVPPGQKAYTVMKLGVAPPLHVFPPGGGAGAELSELNAYQYYLEFFPFTYTVEHKQGGCHIAHDYYEGTTVVQINELQLEPIHHTMKLTPPDGKHLKSQLLSELDAQLKSELGNGFGGEPAWVDFSVTGGHPAYFYKGAHVPVEDLGITQLLELTELPDGMPASKVLQMAHNWLASK